MDPKVSVIIPVYNVEKYLPQCLDSILGQTLEEIEVICVDDGSTDQSLEILQKYREKDRRLKIIQQQNLHAGIARNRGMEIATGEWLAFVDADDFFEKDGLKKLYALGIIYDLDFLKCSSYVYDNLTKRNQKEPYFLNASFPNNKKNTVVNIFNTIELQTVNDTPWSGLYRKRFLQAHNILFPSLAAVNDHSFYIKCLAHAKRVMVSDVFFTHYRINRTGSIIDKKSHHFDCQIQNYYLVKENIKNLAPSIQRAILQRELTSPFIWFQKISSSHINIVKNRQIMVDFCKKFDKADVGDVYLKNFKYALAYQYFLTRPNVCFTQKRVEPKISVIIYIYNTARFLCDCLDSIFGQSFQKFEIIAVDDGSTDDSRKILQEYSQKDARIHVYYSRHQGAGKARQLGTQNAKGQFIQFLDSNDYLSPIALERLWNIVIKLDVDICLYNYAIVDSRNCTILNTTSVFDGENVPHGIFNYKNCSNNLFQIITPNLVTKLFKASFVKPFLDLAENLNGTEDVLIAFATALYAKRIVHLDDVLYFYRQNRMDSLDTEKDSYPLSFVKGYQKLHQLAREFSDYQFIEQSCANRLLRGLVHELFSQKTEAGYQITYEYLKHEGFKNFGLIDQPDKYYAMRDYRVLHYMLSYPKWQLKKEDLLKLSNTNLTESKANDILGKYRFISELKQRREKINSQVVFDNRKEEFLPKVSVILPVYNDEKYLEECINHLLRQTLQDIEVICIDDESADGSLALLKRINDERVVVVTKKNQGQSVARNIGIEMAKGKYLLFCDACDYLDANALKKLYTESEKTDADVATFNMEVFFESKDVEKKFYNNHTSYIRKNNYLGIWQGKDLLVALRRNREYLPAPVLNFINRDFFIQHHLFFLPGIIHEDNFFTFKLMLTAGKVVFIPEKFYHKRIRNNSTLTKAKTFANAYGYFYCLLYGLHFLAQYPIFKGCKNEIYSILEEWKRNGQETYDRLSSEEKNTINLLPENEYVMFKLLFFYKKAIVKQEIPNIFEHELYNVKHGYSFRIGRVITWLPRKVRGGIWCLHDHGIKYTTKRFIEHLGIDMGTKSYNKKIEKYYHKNTSIGT